MVLGKFYCMGGIFHKLEKMLHLQEAYSLEAYSSIAKKPKFLHLTNGEQARSNELKRSVLRKCYELANQSVMNDEEKRNSNQSHQFRAKTLNRYMRGKESDAKVSAKVLLI